MYNNCTLVFTDKAIQRQCSVCNESVPSSSNVINYHHSCCKKGFAMGSMPSTGQTSTTAVPRQTARPSCLVSSVSLNGSSGSTSEKNEHSQTD